MSAPYSIKKAFSLWPVWLLAVLLVSVFWQAVVPPSASWVLSRREGDVSTLYYYWRGFGFGELSGGAVPLWNPYIFCGSPFAAYPESALFYPLNLIFLFLPLPAALNWSFLSHIFLLGVFQFFFLNYLGLKKWASFLGASVLMLSAPVVLHTYAGHLSNICTMAWLPLLFLLAEGLVRTRRLSRAVGLGCILGLQALAGHWQYVFYTIVWLAIFITVRLLFELKGEEKRRLRVLGGGGLCLIVAAGISAVQTLPALEVSRDSFRQALSYEWSAAFSLPPFNLLTFLHPAFLGDTVKSLYWGRYYFWEMCGYLGLVPLFLALGAVLFRRGRTTFLFAGLALGAAVLALGAYTPLFKFLYGYVPGFRYFRGSSKSLFFAAFFLSVLAARGADYLASAGVFGRRDGEGKKGAGKGVIVFAGVLLLLALAALLFSGTLGKEAPEWWRSLVERELLRGRHYDVVSPGEPLWWRELAGATLPDNYPLFVRRLVGETPFLSKSWGVFSSGLFRLGWYTLGFSLLLSAGVFFRRRILNPVRLLLLLLVLGELAFWARPYVVGFDSRTCLWGKEVEEFFNRRVEPFRYLSVDPADFNRGMISRFSSVLGYQADATRRYLEYINASQGNPLEPEELLPIITDYSPLLDLLNLKFFIGLPGTRLDHPGFEEALSTPERTIWASRNAAPRTLVSSRVKVVVSRQAVIRELARPGYRPEDFLVLEEEVPPPFGGVSGAVGLARLVEYGLGEAVVEAESSGPAFLLLNDTFSPGWKAYVDGEERKIYRANYLMRAVCLEGGEERVRFVYRPLSFTVGALVSLFALLCLIVSAVLALRRRRPGPGSA